MKALLSGQHPGSFVFLAHVSPIHALPGSGKWLGSRDYGAAFPNNPYRVAVAKKCIFLVLV